MKSAQLGANLELQGQAGGANYGMSCIRRWKCQEAGPGLVEKHRLGNNFMEA